MCVKLAAGRDADRMNSVISTSTELSTSSSRSTKPTTSTSTTPVPEPPSSPPPVDVPPAPTTSSSSLSVSVSPAPTSLSTPVPASSSSLSGSTTSKAATNQAPSSAFDAPSTKTCPGVNSQPSGPYWLDVQDHKENGAGYAPYASGSKVYPVYRNVLDYGAQNDGSGDQTAKIQKAIDDDGNGGSRKGQGVTRYPAEVFLPGGVYQLESTLYLTVGTIIVGDPQNPPIIRAGTNFDGQFLVMGYDKQAGHPETSFMTLVKNVILDTTGVPDGKKITALQWGVAQASGLTGIEIRMPTNSKTHTGIDINAGSMIAVTDVVGHIVLI